MARTILLTEAGRSKRRFAQRADLILRVTEPENRLAGAVLAVLDGSAVETIAVVEQFDEVVRAWDRALAGDASGESVPGRDPKDVTLPR